MILREYRTDDTIPIHILVIETIDSCYPSVYPDEAVEFFKEYHSIENIKKDCDNGYCCVIEENGKIIATGTLLDTNIGRVFVNPSFQKKGLGKMIMLHLESKAVDHNLKLVELHASLFAKKFYDRLNYHTLEIGKIPVSNGKELVYHKMEKSLNEGMI